MQAEYQEDNLQIDQQEVEYKLSPSTTGLNENQPENTNINCSSITTIRITQLIVKSQHDTNLNLSVLVPCL